MSGNYQEYISKIFLNDEQAKDKIEKLRKDIEGYREAKKKALSMGGEEGDKAFAKAEKNIKKAEAQIKKLSTTAQAINDVLGDINGSSVRELKMTMAAINKELASGRVERNSKEWKALNHQLRLVRTELKNISREQNEIDKKGWFSSFKDILNKNWGAITQIYGAMGVGRDAILKTTQDFADMEEEMANVRKYTGQTEEEIKAMNEEFKNIDTRTSREELNQLAGAAGRLGITAHNEIMDFVDAGDKINVALGEDLGKDAVATIGKLAMAFGEDENMGLRGAMLATGSAVNELAQNSSASASYLVDFSARLSGIAQQAGMTQAQIMGLGSVMDENMQRDEMAATAISNLIGKLAADSSKFAQVAGINAKEFADLVENDMNGALLKFAKTMQGKGGLTELAPLFNEMGLDGSRAVGVLTVLANKVDDVKKNQDLATKAYKEGVSVIEEFNVQNNTVQAGIDKNKKKFKDLSIELGEKLLPVVKYTISTSSMLIKTLSVLIDFLTQYGNVIVVSTTLLIAFNAQKLYHIALTKLEIFWTNKLKKVLIATFTVMKKNPYAAIAIAVTSLGTLIYDLVTAEDKHIEAIKKEQEEAKEFQKSISESAGATQAKYKQLQEEYKRCKSTHEKREWIRKTQQRFSELGISVSDINTAEKVFVKNTKMIMEALKKRAEAAAWQNKLEKLYVQRLDLKAEADKRKSRYYVGAENTEGSYEEGEVLQHPSSGKVTWTAKGVARKHAEIDRETGLAAVDEQIENVSKHAADATKKVEELLDSVGVSPNSTVVNGFGTTNNDKENKELIKKKKAQEKHEKAEFNQHLTELTALYSKGEIDYSEFLERKKKLELDSLAKRKAIWGEESDEAKQMAHEELRILQSYDDAKLRQSIEDIERYRVLVEAKLNAEFYNKDSAIYMNEDALNEALFENDMSALADRIAAEKEGSEQWTQLKAEMQLREQEHRYEQEIRYNDMLLQMRKDFGEYSAEEEKQIAINGLDRLYEIGLIKEEEHQKMLMHIKAKYADNGPGKNTEKFNKDVEAALRVAREEAGDVGDPNKDSKMDSLFGNDFKNWKEVNKKIEELYGSDVKMHAIANAAKAQNDAEYFDTLLSRTQTMYNMINNIVGAASAYSKACSDLEVKKIENNYKKQIEAAGNNTAKKKKLEDKRDREIARAKNKANRKALKIEIAQAIATSAMTALDAYGSAIKALPFPINMTMAPIAAGIALAAGALQIATIKKQHEAQKEGFYEGGFTPGSNYRRAAGIVHQGEFVANHHAVNNASILPALELIDKAQRNNTIATLTAEDISNAVGIQRTSSNSAPIVNVIQDTAQLEAVRHTQEILVSTIMQLQKKLDDGIYAYTTIDGDWGIKKQLDKFNRLIKNK